MKIFAQCDHFDKKKRKKYETKYEIYHHFISF